MAAVGRTKALMADAPFVFAAQRDLEPNIVLAVQRTFGPHDFAAAQSHLLADNLSSAVGRTKALMADAPFVAAVQRALESDAAVFAVQRTLGPHDISDARSNHLADNPLSAVGRS